MQTITIHTSQFDPIIPSESDIRLASESLEQLVTILTRQSASSIQLFEKGHSEKVLELPESAARILVDVLEEMAKGHSVTLVPVEEEISTQQAADILNVSRPYFVQMLDNGELPFRKVGSRRRVKLQDVMFYKRDLYTKRRQTLNELTAYDQELGLQ